MGALLQYLLAAVATVSLALPPGTCSLFQRFSPGKSVSLKASCCQRALPTSPCHSGQTPNRPGIGCCCVHDAALLKKPVQPAAWQMPALHAVAGYLLPPGGSQWTGPTSAALHPPGPSLQILLCVWRC